MLRLGQSDRLEDRVLRLGQARGQSATARTD